ncbi:MAG: PilZ domain-containing protein [bacterium]
MTVWTGAGAGFPTLKHLGNPTEPRGVDEEAEFLQEMPTRRVAPRYIVRIPVGVRVAGSSIDGTIVDISDSGMRVECELPRVPPGTSVALELRCFDLDERVTMLAKLVRQTDGGCALRLVDPDPFLRVFVKLARLHDDSVADRMEKLDSPF